VSRPCPCASCHAPLEPAQELRFLVETANLDNPVYLNFIRRLPAARGKPVPVCKACQARIEASRPRTAPDPSPVRVGVLAAVGLFSVGWMIQNVILGPKG
jgi:hypothetical protein